MFRQINLTLNGNAQVLTGGISGDYSNPPIKQLALQANNTNSNPFYIGDSAISATNFAGYIPAPSAGIPYGHAVLDIPKDAIVYLSDVYVKGTNGEKVKGWVIG